MPAPTVIYLTDATAPDAAAFSQLQARGDAKGDLLVEGFVAVERLLKAGHIPETLLLHAAGYDRLKPLLSPTTTILLAEKPVQRAIVGFPFHRGVIAHMRRPPLHQIEPPPTARTLVVTCGLADPANLGAIIRTARVLGADALYTDTKGADPFSRRAIRAAMGHCFDLPLATVQPIDMLCTLTAPWTIVAATCDGQSEPLSTFTWPSHTVLCIGNEGAGLDADVQCCASKKVRIEMLPGTNSLNVAAALAVLLYQRQQHKASRVV